MTEDSAKINSELTKNAVEIRQLVQDFPLCSTFKEIDEQNVLGNNPATLLYSAVLTKTIIPGISQATFGHDARQHQ